MASAQECQQGGFDLATMISKLNSADQDDAPPSLNRIGPLGTGSTYSSINPSQSIGGISSVASGDLAISRSSSGYDQPWGSGEIFAEDLAGALALPPPPPPGLEPLSPLPEGPALSRVSSYASYAPEGPTLSRTSASYAPPPPPPLALAPPPPTVAWGSSPVAASTHWTCAACGTPRNRPDWAACGKCRAPRDAVPPPPPPGAWGPPPPPRHRSAFDPTPSVLNAVDAVDTFAAATRIDKAAEAAIRALSKEDQIRLVRNLEPKSTHDMGALVRASIAARTNLAATSTQLRGLGPSLCRVADALALRSESVLLLGTLGHREQGRIAKAFAEPGFADGLDGDVDSFVSKCFDDEGARGGRLVGRLLKGAGHSPPPLCSPALRPTLDALRAHVAALPERRMPATALDAFFRSRPDLARPKGLAWLAKYCHAHGLRKVQDPHAAPREAGRAFHLELLV